MNDDTEEARSVPGEDLREFLTFRLSRLQIKLNKQASSILRTHAGLSLSQWRALSLVATARTASKVTLTELAAVSAVDKGLLSRALNSLCELGLVTATASALDHRVHDLALTAEGRACFQRMLPVMQARQAALRVALSDEESAVVNSIIDKLTDAAGKTDFP